MLKINQSVDINNITEHSHMHAHNVP